MVRIRFIAGVVVALATVAQVSAGLLGLDNYSILSFSDINVYNSEKIGKVAAAGNISLSSERIGYSGNITNDEFSVIAGGNVTINNGNIVIGGIIAKGTVTGESTVGGIVLERQTSLPIDFSLLQADARNLSTLLSNNTPTGSVSVFNNTLKLVGTFSEDVNFFNIDANWLKSTNPYISAFELDVPTSSLSVINITNLTSNFSSNWLDFKNFTGSNTLFNFVAGNDSNLNLTLNGTIKSNILAPNVNFSQFGGDLYGCVIANSVSGQFETCEGDFTPPTKDVPEGSTTVMMLAGALLLIVVSKKKLSFSRK